jgi:hypothetical protein
MTLSAFIKLLQKLEAKGHGRRTICVDKEALYDGNGTFNICQVADADTLWLREVDGDGWGIENKDGTERGKTCIVIA